MNKDEGLNPSIGVVLRKIVDGLVWLFALMNAVYFGQSGHMLNAVAMMVCGITVLRDLLSRHRQGPRTPEGHNPSIFCGFSRPHEQEHEAHAPTGFDDPLRPEKEIVDISAPIVR